MLQNEHDIRMIKMKKEHRQDNAKELLKELG